MKVFKRITAIALAAATAATMTVTASAATYALNYKYKTNTTASRQAEIANPVTSSNYSVFPSGVSYNGCTYKLAFPGDKPLDGTTIAIFENSSYASMYYHAQTAKFEGTSANGFVQFEEFTSPKTGKTAFRAIYRTPDAVKKMSTVSRSVLDLDRNTQTVNVTFNIRTTGNYTFSDVATNGTKNKAALIDNDDVLFKLTIGNGDVIYPSSVKTTIGADHNHFAALRQRTDFVVTYAIPYTDTETHGKWTLTMNEKGGLNGSVKLWEESGLVIPAKAAAGTPIPKYTITNMDNTTVYVTLNAGAKGWRSEETNVKLDGTNDDIKFVHDNVYVQLFYSDYYTNTNYFTNRKYLKVKWDNSSTAYTYALSSF